MTALLLAKNQVGEIDLSIGEPSLVQEILLQHYSPAINLQIDSLNYPYSAGRRDIVEYLEDRHKAKIIMTCGAKQAMAAAFFALRQHGYKRISTRTPYWALIPPLLDQYGMKMEESGSPAELLVAPNNPDGWMPEDLPALYKKNKKKGIVTLHDAAYYSAGFIGYHPDATVPTGDIELQSFSKSLGLPGLRIGYCVVRDKKFYNDILQYVESTTAGVNQISQHIIFDLMLEIDYDRKKFELFNQDVFLALQSRRRLLERLNSNFKVKEKNWGMFGWIKVNKNLDLNNCGVRMVEGRAFGSKRHIRLNLAAPLPSLERGINILNAIDEI